MLDYTTNVRRATAATAAPQRKKKAPPINVIAGSVGYNTQHLNSMGIDSDFVSDMKRSIDERMDELERNQKPSWALGRQAPPRMIIATDLILSQFEHRRPQSADSVLPQTKGFCTAMTAYNAYFPLGSTSFIFPQDTSYSPSPTYHCLSGDEILHVDWQLAFLNLRLPCPKCSRGSLVHTQRNFKKNPGSLFPIWRHDGAITRAVIMKYICLSCKELVDANEGRLLQMLPAHVAAAYPVPPRYATSEGGFHLHKNGIAFFEHILKTYANGKQCSLFLVCPMANRYLEKARTYLSQNPSQPFPDFYSYMNNKWPPNGDNIRRFYQQAEYSSLQPYSYSNVLRYTQEIRSVRFERGDTAAFDHTFAATRAYRDKKSMGMKCFADFNNGRTGEIGGIYAVPTTKLSDVSHGLTQAAPRLKNVSVLTTDTIPHGVQFWDATLGKGVKCRLGLFHFLGRMVDTLDSKSEHFWPCLVQLKDCIYNYNKDDWAALVGAVTNGLLGEKLSVDELTDMRFSKVFKQRYDKWLRKEFHLAENIIENLNDWLKAWIDVSDNSDQKVFTYKTEGTTREQFSKVPYVLDHEGAATYRGVKSSAKHGLTEWRSSRAESSLEKFHELLAHFANIGCKLEFANALIARGTAEHNVGARWRYDCMVQRQQGSRLPHPEYVDRTPIFMDHSLLDHLNQQSTSLGFGALFKECRVPEVGNEKEVFFSDYCTDQMERNKQEGTVASTKVCLCDDCKDKYKSPQTTSVARRRSGIARAVDRSAAAAQPSPQQHMQQQAADHSTLLQWLPNNPNFNPVHASTTSGFLTPNEAFFTNQSAPHSRTVCKSRCFPSYPFNCTRFAGYLERSKSGSVVGRPPHDLWCPKVQGYYRYKYGEN
ncbi:unnamed protein product [Cylindrotheca closterium]|uniref:Uncharacterized protein n=1 Tax=Cylindrotheca closterium TaxID=2856 RepID=A0AAD2CG90_9STRA|nr:unnamed protein product [Cylindrotheca closterium]